LWSLINEYHVIANVNGRTVTFDSTYDGTSIVNSMAPASVYVYIPVAYGRKQIEIVLPSITIWGIEPEPDQISTDVDHVTDSWKTTPSVAERRSGRDYKYNLLIDCESRRDELFRILLQSIRLLAHHGHGPALTAWADLGAAGHHLPAGDDPGSLDWRAGGEATGVWPFLYFGIPIEQLTSQVRRGPDPWNGSLQFFRVRSGEGNDIFHGLEGRLCPGGHPLGKDSLLGNVGDVIGSGRRGYRA
jgi:hypothetical protein